MADNINVPGDNRGSNSTAWVLGLIVIVLLVLFLIFVLPTFADKRDATNMQEDTSGDTTILPAPVVNNTVINATSTTNNSTTTRR